MSGLLGGKIRVRIAPGADLTAPVDTWHFETVDAGLVRYEQGINTSLHQRNEGGTTETGICRMVFDNADGDFARLNPLGDHYGELSRNTPITVEVEHASEWHPRFQGFASFQPRWNEAGKADAFAVVNAYGELQRLGQGEQALNSALHRYFTNHPDVIAYWPGEDESGSVSSPIPGVASFTPKGVDFGSADGPPGSKRIIRVPALSKGLMGRVPPHPSTDRYVYQHVFRRDEPPDGGVFMSMLRVDMSPGGIRFWRMRASDTQFLMEVRNDENTVVINPTQSVNEDIWLGERDVRVVLELSQDGEDLDWRASVLTIEPAPVVLNQLSGTLNTTALGRPTRVGLLTVGGGGADRHVGHFALTRNNVGALADDQAPFHGHTGELAGDRFERLCEEELLRCTVIGDTADTKPMGPQRPITVSASLRECEARDQAMLGEAGFGLFFRTYHDMLNQDAQLAVPANGLGRTPLPADDTQQLRNDVTATREGGSSARAVDNESIQAEGRYPDAPRFNPETDAALAHLATWRLHLGTTDEYRWPVLNVGFHRNGAPSIADWLDLTPGDRVTGVNGFDQLPGVDIDVLVRGWSERIDQFTWDVNLNSEPARPWNVFELEHDVFGRLYPTKAVLAEGVNSGATAWPVSTEGPAWINTTDHAAQFPFEVRVAGEVVEVTGISEPVGGDAIVGAGNMSESNTTSHVAPSVDAPGASLLVCAWCSYAQSPSTYSTPGGMSAGTLVQGDNFADMITATESVSAGATGTRTATYSSSDSFSAVSIVLQGLSGAPTVEEDLSGTSGKASGQINPGLTLTTDPATEAGWWLLAIHAWDWDPNDAIGAVTGGGPWTLVADSEQATWETSRTRAWVRRVSSDGPQQVTYPGAFTPWDVHARLLVISGVVDASAQTFTVVRGQNGITKAHPGGAEIELHPGHVMAL